MDYIYDNLNFNRIGCAKKLCTGKSQMSNREVKRRRRRKKFAYKRTCQYLASWYRMRMQSSLINVKKRIQTYFQCAFHTLPEFQWYQWLKNKYRVTFSSLFLNMFSIVLPIFHLIAAGHYVVAMWYDLNYIVFPSNYNSLIEDSIAPLKGRTMFLTWNNLVSLLIATLCERMNYLVSGF